MTKFTPYWWEDTPIISHSQQSVSKEVDVAIIGAGYSGLSAAIELTRAGQSVEIFEKDRLGQAASTRSGGIASGNLRMSFSKMIDTYGLEKAKAYCGEAVEARKALLDFIIEENIECDYQNVGRFQGATRPSHYESMGREVDNLNKHLGLEAQLIQPHEQHNFLGSDSFVGGTFRPDLNGLHPAKLHHGMYLRAIESGAIIHEYVAVEKIDKRATSYLLKTERGVVKAKNVIVATNGYTDSAVPWLQQRLVPVASMIIATDPIDPNLMNEMFPNRRMACNSNLLHSYFRPSPDGSRVLYGGRAPNKLIVDGSIDYSHMKDEMTSILPQLKGIGLSHVWWGYVAMNMDGRPQIAEHNGIHYVGGYCGSGVVWGRWFGQKAAQKILGNPEGHSAFEGQPFKAVPFYNGKPWFLPGVVQWFKLRDKLGF
ncbi:FAD-binding oxidoreductase [Vibrio sp. D420a]|uniref:NAD(P)/FAD-dependent oxidoreductase n=1 Tax=Vibrio sp. D420a TaxID=2836895 RepID=UPI0025533403|nr:FAD-binding oxidoreductase [Vibrio sp. D420a]MDK9764687.1 FAD-binding oxidoreductase [Vibrio sp. D420a]